MNEKQFEELKAEILQAVVTAVAPPTFNGRGVPVTYAAAALGMAPWTLKAQMRLGNLGIGSVAKNEESTRLNYYISPKLLYERTGYIYPPSVAQEPEGEEA